MRQRLQVIVRKASQHAHLQVCPCQEEYIRNPVNRSLSLLAPHMKEPPRFVRHTYVSAISATRVK